MVSNISLVGAVISCLGILLFILVATYNICKSLYTCFRKGAIGDGLILLGLSLVLGGVVVIGIAQYVLKGIL